MSKLHATSTRLIVNYQGNNIDVVQNVPCHFEQSEKSRKRLMLSSSEGYLGASLCRHDTNAEILVLVDNCYIISIINCQLSIKKDGWPTPNRLFLYYNKFRRRNVLCFLELFKHLVVLVVEGVTQHTVIVAAELA